MKRLLFATIACASLVVPLGNLCGPANAYTPQPQPHFQPQMHIQQQSSQRQYIQRQYIHRQYLHMRANERYYQQINARSHAKSF
jgi:hypothetical protein